MPFFLTLRLSLEDFALKENFCYSLDLVPLGFSTALSARVHTRIGVAADSSRTRLRSPHGPGARTAPQPPPPPRLSPVVISPLFVACPARCSPLPPVPTRPPRPGTLACQGRVGHRCRGRGTPCTPLCPTRAEAPRPPGRAAPSGDRGSGRPDSPATSPGSPDPEPPAAGPLTARTGGPAQGAAARHVGAQVVLPHDAHRAALLAPQLQHLLGAEHGDGGTQQPRHQALCDQGACAWRGRAVQPCEAGPQWRGGKRAGWAWWRWRGAGGARSGERGGSREAGGSERREPGSQLRDKAGAS